MLRSRLPLLVTGITGVAGYFTADATSTKPPYSIVLPPPNVTGSLHMGHALEHTMMDALTRRKRMQGYEVLWQPGMDHAGIATQSVVEKQLAVDGKTKEDFGREVFVDKTHVHVVGEKLARRYVRSSCLTDGPVGLKPLVVEGLVGPLENVRDPPGPPLRQDDPQAGEALEDAAEEPVDARHHRVQPVEGHEDRRRRVRGTDRQERRELHMGRVVGDRHDGQRPARAEPATDDWLHTESIGAARKPSGDETRGVAAARRAERY